MRKEQVVQLFFISCVMGMNHPLFGFSLIPQFSSSSSHYSCSKYYLLKQVITLPVLMSFMSFPFLFSTLLSLWSDFSFVDTLKSSIVASGNLVTWLWLSHLKMDYRYQGRRMHKDLLCFVSSWKKVVHKLPDNIVIPGTNYNTHVCVYIRGKCAICKHES